MVSKLFYFLLDAGLLVDKIDLVTLSAINNLIVYFSKLALQQACSDLRCGFPKRVY
jgi:hypothetical protein